MALYRSFSIPKLLSELATAQEDEHGRLRTPTQLRDAALQNLTGVSTLAASDFNFVSDQNGNVLPTPVGTGISAGSGTVHKTSVVKVGDLIYTRIYIDLTGLTSADSDLDVIGVEDTANPCHIGQITAAVNGTIIAGSVQCLEAPASLTDLGIYSAGDGTLVYENLITDESDEVVILTPAVQAVANGPVPIANVPPADSYLYLVNGAADTPDIFTAGKLLIELIGT